MKILYIITQGDGGGAQKYVLSLAKHFNGAIAAGDEAGELFKQAGALGLQTFRLKHLKRAINPWHDILAVWEIRGLIKTFQPDILHLNSTKAGIVGSFSAIGLSTKVVFTAHGFKFLEPMPFPIKMFYLALEKEASRHRDYIIAVSDADRRAALENKLIDENKISTVYNGIGPINFLSREQARARLGLPLEKKIIGVIANDYETKGLDILAGWHAVLGSQVAVIGHAPGKQSTDVVKYLGYVPRAAVYLKAFDGILIPSKKEGFPFVALEAMQAGQPIIASKVGGIPEALGGAGELIQPGDAEAARHYIKADFLDEARSEELSKKSLERSKLFTEQKMLDETEKIYRRLL